MRLLDVLCITIRFRCWSRVHDGAENRSYEKMLELKIPSRNPPYTSVFVSTLDKWMQYWVCTPASLRPPLGWTQAILIYFSSFGEWSVFLNILNLNQHLQLTCKIRTHHPRSSNLHFAHCILFPIVCKQPLRRVSSSTATSLQWTCNNNNIGQSRSSARTTWSQGTQHFILPDHETITWTAAAELHILYL